MVAAERATPAHLPAAAVGIVLGAVLAAAAVLRRAKPLHPAGVVRDGTLTIDRPNPLLGEDLGSAGARPVVVRLSRGIGLPPSLPDIHGLAVRWEAAGHPRDVLLSDTGLGRWGRWTLRLRRRPGPMTSLMPFHGPAGALLLGAVPSAAGYDLYWARPRSAWYRFGSLTLPDAAGATDRPVRFDPVVNVPAGLAGYAWAAQLRRFAYRWSRRAWPTSGGVDGPRDAARP